MPKRIFIVIFLTAFVLAACSSERSTADALDQAFENRLSNVSVAGYGVVLRNLRDDTQGSPHQRFVLKLPSGRTLLVDHNIDLAPRIDGLQVGDTVEFSGEYVWNEQGGLIHWTHHDPAVRRDGGWLRHNGRTYK
jgi:hypothetical protein